MSGKPSTGPAKPGGVKTDAARLLKLKPSSTSKTTAAVKPSAGVTLLQRPGLWNKGRLKKLQQWQMNRNLHQLHHFTQS